MNMCTLILVLIKFVFEIPDFDLGTSELLLLFSSHFSLKRFQY